VVEGFITGLHKSPYHGFSVEFAEHRLYNTGESTRNIDWKLFARSDRLYVKRYEEETNLRCQLIVDTSASMYFPENGRSKMRFAVYACAALMNLLKRQRDAVGLTLYDERVHLSLRSRGHAAHHKLLLAQLETLLSQPVPQQATRSVQALHEVADTAPPRSLIILFSDMFEPTAKADELYAALGHLRYNKHEVLLFHVVDKPLELELNYENRPHVFVDMESGEEVRLNPAGIQEAYRKRAGEFRQELMLRCRQYRIDFIEADANLGFAQILMPYLLKRARMV
jgi:uncharacterized protein (DUF58 family)